MGRDGDAPVLEPAILGLLAVDVGVLTVTINKAYQAQQAGAQERKRQEEEENLTRYDSPQPTSSYPQGGWEFKIVRASFRSFRHRHVLQTVCEEEAQSGWILLEKLDDERLRFRRPVAFRANDRLVARDPYRSYYGPPAELVSLLSLLCLLGLLAFPAYWGFTFIQNLLDRIEVRSPQSAPTAPPRPPTRRPLRGSLDPLYNSPKPS